MITKLIKENNQFYIWNRLEYLMKQKTGMGLDNKSRNIIYFNIIDEYGENYKPSDEELLKEIKKYFDTTGR